MRELRKAPDNLPIQEPTTCLLLVGQSGAALFACTLSEKLSLCEMKSVNGGELIAVWPGKMQSHAFSVDPVWAAAKLGASAP